jgi:hypothetical protein
MKEQYIRMRNANQMDIGLLYTYAVGKGFTLDINSFALGMQWCLFEVIECLDREFGLTLLLDKQGNFMKVVQ